MSELNYKGKIKLKTMGVIEHFKKHSDKEKAFAQEHGTKAYETLALKRSIAKKMDSDSLKEYSRTVDGKKLYKMPEGTYKHKDGKYYRQDKSQESVIHG